MKKLTLFVLVAGGVWWYASHRFNFSDALAYARKNPSASWAPGVEYSIAMIYYQRADYPKAQETFAQLLTDYPTGQYEARSLMRLSEAAEQNADYSTAKDSLSRFLEEFPDSPERPMAERRKELMYNK